MSSHADQDAPVAESIAVVGASHAAVHLADRLRAEGFSGTITLYSQERHLPYQRPPLSKAWLKGAATAESLLLRRPDQYDEKAIELCTGTRVTEVRHTEDGVALAVTDDAGTRERRFDRLVLATGARARQLSLPGADHPDVLVLRDMDHAQRIAERVSKGPIVVIGGGFIGLEVAATARLLGADVTVVEAGSQLMGRAVGVTTADELMTAHRAGAIDIVLGTRPEEITHDHNGIRSVRLADGREIAASTVVVGVGAEPRTELAEQLGLACDGGIVVDDRCVASDGTTLAIGDCTVHVRPDGTRLRLESVDNAIEQANIAACVLLGLPIQSRPAPWFWSDQGDQKLQIVGRIGGHTSVLVRTDQDKPNRRVALYFADDTLVAAECLNSPADFVALRNALAKGVSLSPELFSDNDIPMRRLLKGASGV
ncbi:ferredoxin reductase [Gordonia pseudamarae]|jgi:3-phenylpropionate/trans-cinnamate dioxygenase ferredoxin reductase subunit|uniref:Ferredoxin reductase n=1 Tax=Gordonia pseudamarae TaxID=2831662 RepID=A0ABX6IP90_9ACTN|nr:MULTISPECIES: FAD-dependent oxidoreductase [Gordonia]MBD0022210.1 FAD-dependent oxidoreductase [Gordonia sp. (in: high G+C Gram-positive bacteria)]QHN28225.1 ferredoxin reductase [Gordonia pseudamarae]QHN37085.1 ferredoxin reductase [Gordonia pseudamarae]